MLSVESLLIPSSSLQSPIPPRPSKQLLQDTLYETNRITTVDGRAFVGSFICIDNGLNIILSQAEEFLAEDRKAQVPVWWPQSEVDGLGGYGGRQVGMILIPGKEVVKVEAVVSEEWKRQQEQSAAAAAAAAAAATTT